MKIKIKFFLLLAAFPGLAYCQISFDPIVLPPPAAPLPAFGGVRGGSVVFADLDKDGDQDAIITGRASSGTVAELHRNEGGNVFTKLSSPFTAVSKSSVAVADTDGDGYPEVLISGADSGGNPKTILYANQSENQSTLKFAAVSGISFVQVNRSSVAFADVDQDGDQDVLITGSKSKQPFDSAPATKLYLNNGNNSFQEKTGTSFVQVENSSVAFGDVDGDGDQDVLIAGNKNFPNANDQTATLYTNDGNANFTKVAGTPFFGVDNCSVALADIDGKNGLDVLVAGRKGTGSGIALYTNKGDETFQQVSNPFPGVKGADRSSVIFADVDEKNGPDVFITGRDLSNPTIGIAELFINDGSGNFTNEPNPFTKVEESSVAVVDTDGDGKLDVLMAGRDSNNGASTTLYSNLGGNLFAKVAGNSPFAQVEYGAVAVAKTDKDGNQYIIVTGSKSGTRYAELYKNNGAGTFSSVTGTPFPGVDQSAVAFADVDGDQDQDVIVGGKSSNGNKVQLFINEGNDKFTLTPGNPFSQVESGSIAFADVDNDGDQDVVVTGKSINPFQQVTNLYKNDGNGGFTQASSSFEGMYGSSVAFADLDKDNDQDLLISGYGKSASVKTLLYKNDGSGNFTLATSATFTGAANASLAVADVNGDSWLDVLVSGTSDGTTSGNATTLYKNKGNGNLEFTKVSGTPFVPVSSSSVAFADLDGDSDQDVLITGKDKNLKSISRVYTNDGSGIFTQVSDLSLTAVTNSSVAFGDVDGDDVPDVIISGTGGSGGSTVLYRNTSTQTTPPNPTEYTISASVMGGNGSISPSGAVKVAQGEDKKFTVTPQAGFQIKDVLVNSASQGPLAEYIFKDVQQNSTISASFESVPDTQAPSKPALSADAPTSFSVKLSWTASTDNIGVTSYQVYQDGNQIAALSSSEQSYTAVDLTAATTYAFSVKAQDAAGNQSAESNPVSATFAAPPNDPTAPVDSTDTEAPQAFELTTAANGQSLTLSWNTPQDNQAVTSYIVSVNGVAQDTLPASATSYTATNLSADSAYTFTVVAYDAAGNSSQASYTIDLAQVIDPNPAEPDPTQPEPADPEPPLTQTPTGAPPLFTPNDDGQNDTWQVVLGPDEQLASLRVYDQRGRVVFATSNINTSWDGTFQNQPLPQGAYYFSLITTTNNSSQSRSTTGSVALIR